MWDAAALAGVECPPAVPDGSTTPWLVPRVKPTHADLNGTPVVRQREQNAETCEPEKTHSARRSTGWSRHSALPARSAAPQCCIRRAAEGNSRGAARVLRRLARRARKRNQSGRAGRDRAPSSSRAWRRSRESAPQRRALLIPASIFARESAPLLISSQSIHTSFPVASSASDTRWTNSPFSCAYDTNTFGTLGLSGA